MNQGAAVQALDVDDRDRFIMVYDDVWQALKGKTWLSVYMSLKRRVNPDQKCWYGTYDDLSEEAGVSSKTFKRCIEELEEIGLVVATRRFVPKGWDGKDSSKIVYRASPGKGHQEIGKLYQIRFHMPSGKSDQTGGGKSDQTPLGKSDQTPLGKSDHQTYIPSNIDTLDIETPLIPQGGDGHPSADQFDEFWSVVPKKVGKQAAHRAWKKATRDTSPDVIIEGMKRYRDDPNRSDAFTKNPQGWLNDGRWMDDPLPARGENPTPRRANTMESWLGIPEGTLGHQGAFGGFDALRDNTIDGQVIDQKELGR